MAKVEWKPGTFIYPIPAALITSGTMEKANIMTVAWTGILNTNPAIVYISIRLLTNNLLFIFPPQKKILM